VRAARQKRNCCWRFGGGGRTFLARFPKGKNSDQEGHVLRSEKRKQVWVLMQSWEELGDSKTYGRNSGGGSGEKKWEGKKLKRQKRGDKGLTEAQRNKSKKKVRVDNTTKKGGGGLKDPPNRREGGIIQEGERNETSWNPKTDTGTSPQKGKKKKKLRGAQKKGF